MRHSEQNMWVAVFNGDSADGAEELRGSGDGGSAEVLARGALRAALGGDTAASRRHIVLAEADVSAGASVFVGTAMARGVCWLADSNTEAAWATFAGLLDHSRPAAHLQEASAGVGLLAEAAVRTGRQDETRAQVGRLQRSVGTLADPRCRAELDLAKAILAERGTVGREVRVALDALVEDSDWVRARLELALGMWLRRQGTVRECRPLLNSAVTAFLRLGATPWTRVARLELRAAGVRPEETRGALPLSAQELAIAQLAACGCSNREIGRQLYLSPRTVSSHLYRIFPKLDITSRTQLARLFEVHQSTG